MAKSNGSHTRKGLKLLLITALIVVVVSALAWYLDHHTVAVLQPAGEVARRERELMIIAILLSVIVVVPVYIMAISFAWRYREDNRKIKTRKYQPDWDRSRVYETLWWGIPIIIIGALSVITWESSHALDPFKPLSSSVPAIPVDVVALDWKWLFIYPKQHIASVNLLEIPSNVPIDFDVTSDTVMNSFWIPRLGGQIYAMPGMSTQLHLIANETGSYYGSSANISGVGFAGMNFTTKSVSWSDFNAWVKRAQASSKVLTSEAYSKLAEPSQNNKATYYSDVPNNLYDDTVMKYMSPLDMPTMPASASSTGMYMQ
ncbi:MAG TPA: ubiquinol oxidase subunit II [Candidatus Saccharimonadales bacterium]|nr:ubiquinol oxidase subunit II [Candidatus Saccharimonadales bacterium]